MTRKATYDLVLEAIGAALIVAGAFISITVTAVPFTLQTMALMAVLMTCGGRRGTISTVCYLLMGVVGLPVFAGFQGGVSVILGPTGGFLVGFIPVGLIYWGLADKMLHVKEAARPRRIAIKIISAIICEVALYAVGVAWFMTVYARQTGPIGLTAAISMCVVPFILPDIAKTIAAIIISEACHKIVKD